MKQMCISAHQNACCGFAEQEFDAIVLCCGSTKPRDLNVPGRDGNGVVFAVDYLTIRHQETCSISDNVPEQPDEMNAKGKNVIVIGGGDTGTDCVGTALRQGCKSVVQFEIMPEPGALNALQATPGLNTRGY